MRKALLFLLLLIPAHAFAVITIRLSAFPDQLVADGRSATTITLEVRSNDGKLVPDGTRILLSSTLGNFRETIVTTQNGIARAILIAGNITGTARITAAEISTTSNPSVIDVEFVKSRDQLATNNDFIEIESTQSLEYVFRDQIATASAVNRGVKARFLNYNVKAKELQFAYGEQVIRARDAIVKWENNEVLFDDFYIDIRKRKAYGFALVETVPFDRIGYRGGVFFLQKYDYDLGFIPAPTRKLPRIMEVTSQGLRYPTTKINPSIFNFKKVREGIIAVTEAEYDQESENDYNMYRVTAKRMLVISRRTVQFQSAKLYIPGNAIRQGLLTFDLNSLNQSPISEWVGVNNSAFTVNYPAYISLERDQTQNFRFRTGQNFGRGINLNRGFFVDFEQNWNARDERLGSFVVTGVGRDDFNLGFRQFARFNSQTNANFVLDSPQARSLISSVTLNRQADAFQYSFTASNQRALRGSKVDRQDYFAFAEHDPVKVGKLPVQMFYGLNASFGRNVNEFSSQESSGLGARLRFQSNTINLKGNQSLLAGITFNQQFGTNLATPLAINGNVSLTKTFSEGFTTTFMYDYTYDGFTEQALGLNRLSIQSNFFRGNYDISINYSQSLGLDRFNLFTDASLRFSPKWRISNQYTINSFIGETFLDYNWLLAYRLKPGIPEIGLVLPSATQRLGFTVVSFSRN